MGTAANDNYSINISADNSKLKVKVQESLVQLDQLGIAGSKAANDLIDLGSGVKGASTSMLALGAVIGGITAAAAGFAYIASDINETRKAANEAKMGIEQFSQVFQVLGANVEQSELAGMMSDFSEKLGEAAQGSGSLYEQMQNLNLTASELTSLNTDEAIAKYYYAAKNAGMGTQQLTFLMEEAGSGLSNLIGTFDKFSSESAYLSEVQSKNAKYTQEQAEQFQALEKAGKDLGTALLSLAAGSATVIAEFFTTIATGVSSALNEIDGLIDAVGELRAAMSSKIDIQDGLFANTKNIKDVQELYKQTAATALAKTGYDSVDDLKKRIDQLKSDPAVQAALKRDATKPTAVGYGQYKQSSMSNYDTASTDPANAMAAELNKLQTLYAGYTKSIENLEAQKTDKVKALQMQDTAARDQSAKAARTAQEIHADSTKAYAAEYAAETAKIKALYADDTAEQQKQLAVQTKIYQDKQSKADAALKQAEDSAKKSTQVKKAELTDLQMYADELKKLGVTGEDYTKALQAKELELRLSNNEKIKNALNLKVDLVTQHWAAVGGVGNSGLAQIKAQNLKETQEFEAHYKALEALGENTTQARKDLLNAQNQRVQDYINQQIESGNTKDLTSAVKASPSDFSSTQIDKILQDQSVRTGMTEADPLAEMQVQQQQEMDLIAAMHEQKLIADDEYFQRKAELEASYSAQSQAVQMQNLQLNMQYMQQSAEGMYQTCALAFGKTSRATRAMFIAAKMAAIGTSIMNIYQWATASAAEGGLSGWALYAAVLGQIPTIVGSIKSVVAPDIAQFHDGITSVRETGSYYLQSGERVLSRDKNADLSKFLDNQNRQNSSTAQTINAQTIVQGNIYGDQGIVDVITRNRGTLLATVNKAEKELGR